MRSNSKAWTHRSKHINKPWDRPCLAVRSCLMNPMRSWQRVRRCPTLSIGNLRIWELTRPNPKFALRVSHGTSDTSYAPSALQSPREGHLRPYRKILTLVEVAISPGMTWTGSENGAKPRITLLLLATTALPAASSGDYRTVEARSPGVDVHDKLPLYTSASHISLLRGYQRFLTAFTHLRFLDRC